jgi:D-threo-aldose 1-dehydrogenase
MAAERVEIGATGLMVPRIAFGTSGLGGMPATYGYDVAEERALATIRTVLADPQGFLDSSRNYGAGRSEARIGTVVRELGGWPEGRVLSTKLDRDMETGRFDAGQARRSVEESLAALGRDRVEILHLHDPEHSADLGEIAGPAGALAELFRMKDEGLATAVGLAAGRVDVMMPLLSDWDFDVLITHNRLTLVNRNAEPMIELARARGISVMNAAPYASGALAKGASSGRYVYQEATEAMLAPIRRVEEACARHGIPPGAAALQFSMRDPRIAVTVCGVSRPERVAETLEWARWPIGEAAWQELLGLPYATDDPEATRDYKPG